MWTEGNIEKSCLASSVALERALQGSCVRPKAQRTVRSVGWRSVRENMGGARRSLYHLLDMEGKLGFCRENKLLLTVSLSMVQVRKGRPREPEVPVFAHLY